MDYTTVYTRICKDCESELPATEEYFPRAKNNFLGIAWECRECQKLKAVKYNQDNRQARLEYSRRNPEKIRAHKMVKWVISQGRMKPASEMTCACGQPAAHYHHADYSKPLDVTALCRTCHGLRHRS